MMISCRNKNMSYHNFDIIFLSLYYISIYYFDLFRIFLCLFFHLFWYSDTRKMRKNITLISHLFIAFTKLVEVKIRFLESSGCQSFQISLVSWSQNLNGTLHLLVCLVCENMKPALPHMSFLLQFQFSLLPSCDNVCNYAKKLANRSSQRTASGHLSKGGLVKLILGEWTEWKLHNNGVCPLNSRTFCHRAHEEVTYQSINQFLKHYI